MRLWYSSDSDTRHEIVVSDRPWCLSRPIEQRELAELCADDFHSNHDGWECSWPREFTLYESETDPALVSFEVYMEAMPVFRAHSIKPSNG